ncbi:MAG: carboxypeptidase-like regulatory domain-containing protein [Candidatus Sumerlaeaceae bacterium]|nr:carboxypeptidase-like regulatory domain-containing protein [Candidatus Sumerlaeaceae bacterium]
MVNPRRCRQVQVLLMVWLLVGAGLEQGAAYYEEAVTSGGRIMGTVEWAGDLPVNSPFEVTVDRGLCAPGGTMAGDAPAVTTGSLMLRGAVVFLRNVRSGKPLAKLMNDPAAGDRLIFDGCRLSPRLLVTPSGTDLTLQNLDAAVHRPVVFGPHGSRLRLEMAVKRGTRRLRLTHGGAYRVLCERHPWEHADVYVAEHPYHSVTGTDGSFVLEDVPPGSYDLIAWHPGLDYRQVIGDDGMPRYLFDFPVQVRRRVVLKPGETEKVVLRMMPK